MEEEDIDNLTEKILSGDIEIADLDALVGLLVVPEAFAQLRTEVLTSGMDPVWLLAMELYCEQLLNKTADRVGDDLYALGYFQGMMAGLNAAMKSTSLVDPQGKALEAMEHSVNIISSRFAKVRTDAWPMHLEIEGEDYEH